MYTHVCVCIYIYIYICSCCQWTVPREDFEKGLAAPPKAQAWLAINPKP